MREFWDEVGKWSHETFGPTPKEAYLDGRGPIGPLNHLKKEAEEAIAAVTEYKVADRYGTPGLAETALAAATEEIVDCCFLVFDAARRLGVDYDQFETALWDKLKKNKARKWQPPNADGSVEHER